jgi:hypothetical protein
VSWKQDLPGPKEIDYGGWPRETDLSDYSKAASEVVELVARMAPGASVYQVGGVSAPGISDLDFIVVLNDPDSRAELDQWGMQAGHFSPQTQYIVDNKPLIADPELWHSLPILHSLRDLRHLSGPVLSPPVSSGSEAGASHLFNEVERRLFVSHKLERYLLKRSVHVRTALKKLAKLKYDAEVLAEVGIENGTWSEFSEAVSTLRRDWFSLDRARQTRALYPLLAEHAGIEAEIIRGISEGMIRAGMDSPKTHRQQRDIVGAFDLGKLFVRDYRVDARLRCLAQSYRLRGEVTSLLPMTFMLPVLIYTNHSPVLRGVFGNRLTIFEDMPDISTRPLQNGIAERIRILERYFDFIKRRRYGWGLFFNMWNFPIRDADVCRRFWMEGRGAPVQSADILPFLLRKRLEVSHPFAARLVSRGIAEAFVWGQRLRERLRPVGTRLRRSLGRAPADPPASSKLGH